MNDKDCINWPRAEALCIAREALAEGFRAYIAESGNYGFFTDDARVVSFQVNHFATRFSGNYCTSAPRLTGTSWELDSEADYADMLKCVAPRWAHQGASWSYTTLAEYLAAYDPSSKYQEVKV